MKLTFLGKESKAGDSPTLYATDRGTYLVQGYKVDEQALADVPDGQTRVMIYDRLLDHLAEDGVRGSLRGREFPIVSDVDGESCIIQGSVVTDTDARTRMRMPEHEDCIEVPKAKLAALMGDR